MKIKLTYKLFSAFLIMSLMIVVIMVALMQFYSSRNFADYINKMEMARADELVNKLAEEYNKDQGWNQLTKNPRRWVEIIHPQPPVRPRFSPELPGFDKAQRTRWDEGPMPPPPPPPHLFDHPDGEPLKPGGGPPPGPLPPGLPRPELGGSNWPPPPPQHPLMIGPRISLFDVQKQPLAGHARNVEDHQLQAIKVDGNIVGWLGLKKLENLSNPLDVEFAQGQTRAFYLIGGSVLLLATFFSLFLARHLLAPIKRLTEGTQAISSRRFDTRIDVRTGDELGQLAADFNRMAKAMEQYEQLRQQWISDISHELRTPLAILRAEIEALQDGIRESCPENLDSLHAEVLHITKIVQDLHDLSLADAGRLSMKREPVNAGKVLQETLQGFQTRLAGREIQLQEELAGEDKHYLISADADRLKQIFTNVLENSLRYTDSPGILTIWQELKETGLSINFQDSGPGVPEESLEKLFDRLYRVDASRSRLHGGSGLGLAICKSLVQALDGEIKAAPAPSGGLWIEIIFPLGAAANQ